MRWKGIGFDLDNTLFSHELAFKKAIQDSYYKYGNHVEITRELIPFDQFFLVFKENSDKYWNLFEQRKIDGNSYRRLRFNETMKTLDLPYGDDLADFFHTHYYHVVDNFSVPFPKLHELMAFLADNNIKIFIITNGTEDTQYAKVKKLGIGQRFPEERVIVSEKVGISKPKREIFRLAEERFALTPEQLLFVGDSWLHDVCGSLDAGWEAIFLNTRGEKRKSDHHQSIKEFRTLEEVYTYISTIIGGGKRHE